MEIARPKLVYSIIAVGVLVSASVLVTIYSGFFDDLNGEESTQENITEPMVDSENTVIPGADEVKN